MEDTENANDLYMEFKNGKTKLNDITLNQLQRLIKEDIRENGGGGGDITGILKLVFPIREHICNTNRYKSG